MNTKTIINLGLVAVTLAFVACTNTPADRTKMERQVDNAIEDIGAAKTNAAKRMRELHEKLAIRLVKVEARLQEPGITVEQRNEWETSRTELKAQMKRLEDGLAEVEGSTNETWKDVKEGMRQTTEDVDNWFKRQAEIIDRKTDADKDNDGH